MWEGIIAYKLYSRASNIKALKYYATWMSFLIIDLTSDLLERFPTSLVQIIRDELTTNLHEGKFLCWMDDKYART